MKRLRTVLFWCHLTAGVTAGLVILIMSVTGALLAFERQIVETLERDVRLVKAPASPDARASVRTMLAAAARAKSDARPTGVTLTNHPEVAAAVAFGREGTVYVNPYTGEVTGEGALRARLIFQALTSWHRWLGF